MVIHEAPDTLRGMARELAIELSARAGEAEALRTMPRDLVDKLKRAGLFRMSLPKALGGLELDPITTFEIVELLAAADGSAGWTVMIGNAGNAQFAWLDPGVAADMTDGGTEFSTTGMFAPLGTIIDDGYGHYEITGRWPFNSGCVHSEWYVVAVVPEGVKPSAGRSETLLAFLPRGLATIEDTWYAAGLQGTGSHHLSIASARIPHEHAIAAFSQPAQQDGALWRLPFRSLITVLCAGFPLGVARRALDEFVEIAKVKVRRGAPDSVGQDGHAQVEYARAAAEVDAARCFLLDAMRDEWRTASAGEIPSRDQRARVVLASNQAMRASIDAVDRVFRLAGASSVMADHPLQRCFRDIHTANTHLFWSDARDQAVARVHFDIAEPPFSL